MSKSDDFLWQCRANYFIGIRPGDQNAKNLDGYKVLVEIAKEYFRDERYDAFTGFFSRGTVFYSTMGCSSIIGVWQTKATNPRYVSKNNSGIFYDSPSP